MTPPLPDAPADAPAGALRVNSLFSGAGTFDFGAHLAGWKTVSLCEFDPQAQAVLTHRLPGVPLHPDIRTLRGSDLPDAEVVMGGSPCQSLSVAGKRTGIRIATLDDYLRHKDDPELQEELSASSLFWEMVRVIQEKRDATAQSFPRFALWENVPGTFSSHGGEDFRIVLSAFLGTDVPLPRSGKWGNAGVVRGNGREVAWRVLDSQFFGVPQRRRRIFLVCDFAGRSAADVLFESESLPGHPAPGGEPGQDAPATAGAGAAGSSGAGGVGPLPALSFRERGREGGRNLELLEEQAYCLTAPTNGSRADSRTVAQPIPAWEPARALLGKQGWRGDGESDNLVVALPPVAAFDEQQITSPANMSRVEPGMPCPTLNARGQMTALFPQLATASGLASTLGTSQNGQGTGLGSPRGDGSDNLVVAAVPVAFQQNQRDEVRLVGGDGRTVGALAAQPGAKQQNYIAAPPSPIAFHVTQDPIFSDRVTPCLTAGTPEGVGALGVAFALRGREGGALPEVHGDGSQIGALRAAGGGSSRDYVATAPVAGVERNGVLTGDVTHTLQAAGSHGARGHSLNCTPNVITPYAVRRLTPVEAERLQGMPEIDRSVVIDLCPFSAPQTNGPISTTSAPAEMSKARKVSSVGNAGKIKLMESASFAELDSGPRHQGDSRPARPHVLIRCGEQGLEISSQGKCLLSVGSVAHSALNPLPVQIESFVQMCAGIASIAAQTITFGGAASLVSVPHLTLRPSGDRLGELFGSAITPPAKSAASDTRTIRKPTKPTTSNPFDTENLEQNLAILFSCVGTATSGFIPLETLRESGLRIQIESKLGWTAVPWKGGVMPDSARYRMMGNGGTSYVLEYLFTRIAAVLRGRAA